MRFKLEFTGSYGLCQLGGFLCRYGTDYDYHRCTFLRCQQGTEKGYVLRVPAWHGSSDCRRCSFLRCQKGTEKGNPGSLERPQQIQAFKARAKLTVRLRRPAHTVARLKP